MLVFTLASGFFVKIQPVKALCYYGREYLSLTTDVDINDDGVINQTDLNAFYAAYPSVKTDAKYVRGFDIDFDGDIDLTDKTWMEQYTSEHPNLQQIRDAIITGGEVTLTCTDGFTVKLRTLKDDESAIRKFTGTSIFHYQFPQRGWVHICNHPRINEDQTYVCEHFAEDTALAAYKALGYGTIMYAVCSNFTHAYNIFFVGGDWTKLYNWRIIDPEYGRVFSATAEMGYAYRTRYIYFLDRTLWMNGHRSYQFRRLAVDYLSQTVGPEEEKRSWYATSHLEEDDIPVPYTFDTSLGTTPGDLNEDGKVDLIDFSILLSKWGTSDATADINCDGIVDLIDLSILMSHWTG